MKSILYGNSQIGFGDSIYISIISMLIVFFVLIIISYILSLLKYIPSEKKDGQYEKSRNEKNFENENLKNSGGTIKKLSPEDIKDERMLAAVSAALIEAAGDSPESYIRIRSIRELN